MERKLFSILLLIFSTSFIQADVTLLSECYKCTSTDTDRSCIDEAGTDICKTEVPDCFWNKTETGVVRGCFNRYEEFGDCDKNSENCSRCRGTKCNGEPITEKPSLKCFKCDNCPEISDNTLPAEICSNSIPYKKTEMCFTYIKKADGKDERTKKGCFYDLSDEEQSECLKADKDCKTCNEDGCNKETNSDKTEAPPTQAPTQATESTNTPIATDPPKPTEPPNLGDFKCIICRSDVNNQNACASKEIKGEYFTQFNKKCEATPQDTSEKGCYIQRLEDNVVIRDCFSTASALKLDISEEACDIRKNPKTKCSYCDRTECNIGEPRSSGNQLGTYGAFVALAALLVTRFL